jgi:UDP-glucuronate 4-epimerase
MVPYSESKTLGRPLSVYSVTKICDEMLAEIYHNAYKINFVGLRFFTVYGPWGRPDMALFLFTKAALEGNKIDVFNNGEMLRDFTYIDDIVEGVIRVIDNPAKSDKNWNGKTGETSTSSAPYKIYNIGNNNPVKLMDFITAIENKLGKTIEKNMMPIQAGDVPATYADVSDLVENLGYKPATPIQEGINKFVDWYLEFFGYSKDGSKK